MLYLRKFVRALARSTEDLIRDSLKRPLYRSQYRTSEPKYFLQTSLHQYRQCLLLNRNNTSYMKTRLRKMYVEYHRSTFSIEMAIIETPVADCLSKKQLISSKMSSTLRCYGQAMPFISRSLLLFSLDPVGSFSFTISGYLLC